jgi:hypothetical protein
MVNRNSDSTSPVVKVVKTSNLDFMYVYVTLQTIVEHTHLHTSLWTQGEDTCYRDVCRCVCSTIVRSITHTYIMVKLLDVTTGWYSGPTVYWE